jgi:hypothetical protein
MHDSGDNQAGVGVFDELFVDDTIAYVEAPDLAALNADERKQVADAIKPFEEARRSAKLRGDLRLYG